MIKYNSENIDKGENLESTDLEALMDTLMLKRQTLLRIKPRQTLQKCDTLEEKSMIKT